MYEASRYLIGCHDFRSFQASGCAAGSTVRTVYKIDIVDTDSIRFLDFLLHGNFIIFRFEADAFLRYMVRNMVGTLIEVGVEKLLPSQIKDIIDAKDRKKAGPTAPPQGLFLEKIYY
jgi:tRNA pseudouridine38-40 synthase